MDYPIVIVALSEDDGGGWAGFVPDLPGCMSDGETRVEALTNTEDAIGEWLDACAQMGREAPKPGSAAAEVMALLKEFQDKILKLAEMLHTLSGKHKELDAQFRKLVERVEKLEASKLKPLLRKVHTLSGNNDDIVEKARDLEALMEANAHLLETPRGITTELPRIPKPLHV